MVEYPHLFYEDLINNLFLAENMHPVVIGAEIKDKFIIRHPRGKKLKVITFDFWRNNPENMENVRFWLYNKAKGNSVYVDDKYIILVLDKKEFYQKRELVARALDE